METTFYFKIAVSKFTSTTMNFTMDLLMPEFILEMGENLM